MSPISEKLIRENSAKNLTTHFISTFLVYFDSQLYKLKFDIRVHGRETPLKVYGNLNKLTPVFHATAPCIVKLVTIHSYFDKIITKFMINNWTDA